MMSYIKRLLGASQSDFHPLPQSSSKILKPSLSLDAIQSIKLASPELPSPLEQHLQKMIQERDEMIGAKKRNTDEIARRKKLEYEQNSIIEALSRGIESLGRRKHFLEGMSENSPSKNSGSDINTNIEDTIDTIDADMGDELEEALEESLKTIKDLREENDERV